MSNFIKTFAADESGATAIEYGMIAALIAVVIMAAVQLIGERLDQIFDRVAACLRNPSAANCAAPAAV